MQDSGSRNHLVSCDYSDYLLTGGRWASTISLHPASCILHPASCILHPESCILNPASCYKLSTNSVIRSNASLIDFTLHSKGW